MAAAGAVAVAAAMVSVVSNRRSAVGVGDGRRRWAVGGGSGGGWGAGEVAVAPTVEVAAAVAVAVVKDWSVAVVAEAAMQAVQHWELLECRSAKSMLPELSASKQRSTPSSSAGESGQARRLQFQFTRHRTTKSAFAGVKQFTDSLTGF